MLAPTIFQSSNILNIVKNTYRYLLLDERLSRPPSIARLIAFYSNAQPSYKFYLINFPDNPDAGLEGIIRAAIKSLALSIRVKQDNEPEIVILEAVTRAIEQEGATISDAFLEKLLKNLGHSDDIDIEEIAEDIQHLQDEEVDPQLAMEMLTMDEDLLGRRVRAIFNALMDDEFEEKKEFDDTGKHKLDLRSPVLDLPTKLIKAEEGIEVDDEFNSEDLLRLAGSEAGEHLIERINQIVGEDAPLSIKLAILRELLQDVNLEEEGYDLTSPVEKPHRHSRKILSETRHMRLTSFRLTSRGSHVLNLTRPQLFGVEVRGIKSLEPGQQANRIRRQLTARKASARSIKGQSLRPEDIILKTYKPGVRADFVVAVDCSDSMRGAGAERNKLTDAKRAILKLIEAADKDDKMAIITFETRASVVLPLTKVREIGKELPDFLVGLRPSGGTKIASAFTESERQFERSRAKTRFLILLTDGDTKDDQKECCRLARKLYRRFTSINTIAIGRYCDEGFLRRLAKIGRGSYIHVQDSSDWSKVSSICYGRA